MTQQEEKELIETVRNLVKSDTLQLRINKIHTDNNSKLVDITKHLRMQIALWRTVSIFAVVFATLLAIVIFLMRGW